MRWIQRTHSAGTNTIHLRQIQRNLLHNGMYAPKILSSIHREHCYSIPHMVETLCKLDVPPEDAALLGRMPWEFAANRIAFERNRLGMLPVHPLIDFKLPPPPPAWLTPAVIVMMFDLALHGPGEPPQGCEDEDEETNSPDGILILPA